MRWTQEPSIAFESARECITVLMSLLTAQMIDVEANRSEESANRRVLNARIMVLFKEYGALTTPDDVAVCRVRLKHGPEVRRAFAEERTRGTPSAGHHEIWRLRHHRPLRGGSHAFT